MELAHLHIEASKGPLSTECVDRGIISYLSLMQWVEELPYHRNTDRSSFHLVLDEERGTCSTKHALLKAVADENQWDFITLHIGIYEMSAQTNPEIQEVLEQAKLSMIPEAHTYLRVHGEIKDLTGLSSGETSFQNSLTKEEMIQPEQIGDDKLRFHQEAVKSFAASIDRSYEEIWKIREACIAALHH